MLSALILAEVTCRASREAWITHDRSHDFERLSTAPILSKPDTGLQPQPAWL
jgi:hypothetical protein